jgi:ribosomal protein S18 acetylase RimI-like enzyme
MATETVIRDLAAGDEARLVEIALAAWEPLFVSFRAILGPELFEAEHPDWRAEKAEQIRGMRGADDPGTVLVAERAGTVVGFVSFYANVRRPDVGEIGSNAVHPDAQGQGIAGELYAAACERLRTAGMRFVRVSTGGDALHAPARRAYEKAGFDVVLPGVTYYRRLQGR